MGRSRPNFVVRGCKSRGTHHRIFQNSFFDHRSVYRRLKPSIRIDQGGAGSQGLSDKIQDRLAAEPGAATLGLSIPTVCRCGERHQAIG